MDKVDNHIAIDVKDLAIGYRNKKSVSIIAKDISFKVETGKLMSIIGVNGIGKSTLLRTLGKVQPVIEGEIAIQNKKLNDLSSLEMATHLSLVLTEPLASKNLTVSELIALGRQPYTNWIGQLSQTDIEKINEAINMVQLEKLRDKKCYELSDGQLQRVMIARAIAQDTSIILLDEPTAHLDLHHKVQILKLLKSIAQQTKKTILYTSHEIEIAIQLCDKILILNKDHHTFGSPSSLIEDGAFSRIFPTNTVTFDPKTSTFIIEK